MLNKLIKKIISWFGYKLVEKNYIKNRRTLSKNFFDLDKILNHIFSNNLAKNIIQIGANDGKRFDPLNKYLIKYETKTIFVEPIKEHFEKLKRITLIKIIVYLKIQLFQILTDIRKYLK